MTDTTKTWIRGEDLPFACGDSRHGRLALGQWSLTVHEFDPNCPTCARRNR